MRWVRMARQFLNAARQRGASGRLMVIPMVLMLLVPHFVAVFSFVLLVEQQVWAESVSRPIVLTLFLLGAGTPLGLAVVWRKARPTRRTVRVYDWVGGGLLALSVAWLGMALNEWTRTDQLGAWGQFLIPFSAVLWGGTGVGLIMAGTVYLSAELRQETRERQSLEALMEFTRHITSLDYQGILDEAVRRLQHVLKSESCVLYLWDQEKHVLVPVAAAHDTNVYGQTYIDRMMSFCCPLGYGLTGWVMQTGHPYISDNVVADPRSQAVPDYQGDEKSSLLAPIQVEGHTLGVVRLTREGLHQFGRDDLDLAMSFAGQAALVIEHVRIVKELSDLSITDPLTGLYNARHFHHVLDMEVRRSLRYDQPLSLVMTDSDSLKKVNDLLGHQRGDEHLKSIGRALKSAVRITDYAFRYAGDEFLLLLPNTGPADAVFVGERVRRMMEEEDIGGGLKATVSVGVATLPEHAGNGELLLAAADWAMYESKRSGKNRTTLAHADWASKR